jgi:hypothetical protein
VRLGADPRPRERRDFTALLVPAEMTAPKPAAARRVNLTTTVAVEVAAQVRNVAAQQRVTVSALIASAPSDYLANV